MNPTNSNTTPAPYLVTGANGLSGSIIVKELSRQGIPVRALVRDAAKATALQALPGVSIYVGDMLRPETLDEALCGVEKTIVISSAFQAMVQAQQTFIDAAIRAGVRHIIKYSGAESGIGFSAQAFEPTLEHEQIEDYLVQSGIAWTMLRPSQFMEVYFPGGPTGISPGQAALFLPGDAARLAPVSLDDVAKVCVKLLVEKGHEGRIYEMTGPDSLTTPEVCAALSEALGTPIAYHGIPMEAYRQRLITAGAPQHVADQLICLWTQRNKCVRSHIKLDTHREFGIRPTTFTEFAYRNTVAFGLN